MCAAAKFQVVFTNWQSAFHAMQLDLLLYFHLSISYYLLKPVQKELLSSDSISQQAYFPSVKLSTPTTGNKLQPTSLNAATKIALMA